jgi:imidazolonepropionase-like amidohydrolase
MFIRILLTMRIIIDEMVRKGIYLVPTMYTQDTMDLSGLKPEIKKKIEADFPLFEKAFQVALQKGVKMAFGSDSGQIAHGENAKEFSALVTRGMKPLDAIQSATVNAADLLSLKDRGIIAEGLRADLVAVKGNPLEDIRLLEKPNFVMKRGSV